MSTSSQVFIGYYIKAKCTKTDQIDTMMGCSSGLEHNLPHPTPKFCPECGKRVGFVSVPCDIDRSLYGIQWEDGGYDWIKQISPIDIEWINENFSAVDTAYIDGEEGYDYIMCGHYQSIDGLEDAVIPMSILELTTRPSVEDIERLQTLMQYASTELLFGALVSVSS